MKREIGKSNIVILGHSGFLGSCLYENFSRDSSYKVLGFSSPQIDLSLSKECPKVIEFLDNNTIVIMAASGLVREKSFTALKKDIDIIVNVADLISQTSIKHLIYISSIAVYGRTSDTTIDENSKLRPDDFYSIAKVFGEKIFELFCLNRRIALTILRPGIIYGRDDIRSPFFRFMNNIRLNRDIEIFGDGSTKIFWVHQMDLYQVIKSVIDDSKLGDYNIVSDEKGISLLDLAKFMFKICGRRVDIKFNPTEKIPINLNFDTSKFRVCFPEVEFLGLEDGLQDLI